MRFAVLILIALSMSGCGDVSSFFGKLGFGGSSDERLMQEVVRASLKDPESAKFGKMTQVSYKRACLTVNGKNAYGGYTGEQQAYLLKSDGKWAVIYIDDKLGHSGCIKVMSEE